MAGNGNEATPIDHRPAAIADLADVVALYALDRDNAARLWELSKTLV